MSYLNCLDPDEVAHYEPPHLDLHCFSLIFDPNMIKLEQNIFLNFAGISQVTSSRSTLFLSNL